MIIRANDKNIISKLKIIFFGIIDSYLSVSKLYIGGYLLNILGLQVIRSIFKNTLHKLKYHKTSIKKDDPILLKLEEEGIVLINNFMPVEEFNALKQILANEEKKNFFNFTQNHEKSNVSWTLGRIYKQYDETKKAYEILNKNFLNYLPYIETVLKQTISKNIKFNYQKLYLPKDKIDIKDSNAHLHTDKFFPCIKCFISIKDCLTVNDGPFFYMKKSHKLNFNKLKSEYINSIWYYKRKRNTNYDVDNPFEIKLDYINHLKIEPILCEENTLIITNNMGCHKRGRLSSGHSRKLIRISFYEQQLPFYKRLISDYLTNRREKKVVKKLKANQIT